ncbi:MAG: methyltransferase domain-containing protein [Bacteroidetes bacterium]|nr:MAG: methyltransferase domain-containing protein [Bacteroidota bacterium]
MSDVFSPQHEKETLSNLSAVYKLQMSDEIFEKLSQFIYSQYGIKMPMAKKVMLQSRLQRRLREMKMDSYEQYCDFVFSKEGEAIELVHMIDVVTTNKTDFFREPAHFDFLRHTVLPEFVALNKQKTTIKIWSAGCSSGEEVYTLAMVLSDFIENNRNLDYSILGTDISSRILQKAFDAVYTEERVSNIPLELKKKYFLRSRDRAKPTVRLIPEIRKKASYQRLNFMDDSYHVQEKFDVIFCRNVLIYFDRDTQQKVINRLCSHLKSGGYFFLGHSESITGMNVPLVQLKPTVFMKI